MERSIRVATYNIHKCKGMDGRVRPGRILEVLAELDADVVGLQEVVSLQGSSPERNQAEFLANGLAMHLAAGENRPLEGGAYGNVLLSRYPVRSHCNHDVSIAGYEPRGCLRSDIMLPENNTLHIFNVHFGTGFFERRRQARILFEKEILRGVHIEAPRVVVGDFNEWTAGHLTRALKGEFKSADIRLRLGRKRTYPGLLPFWHLDHIYYDRDLEMRHVALHRTKMALIASDHLPIVADFVFRKDVKAQAGKGPAAHEES